MKYTFHLEANLPASRKLELSFPHDIPAGPVDIVVSVSSRNETQISSGRDLVNSEIFGMWKDRKDVDDSVEFVKELRERAWKRVN